MKGIHQAVVAHAFNPSTWEAEAGTFLSLRPARATKRNLSRKTKKKKKKKNQNKNHKVAKSLATDRDWV
jgi:hypothetical protein